MIADIKNIIMNRFKLILLIFFIGTFYCSAQNYEIHIGKSYYSADQQFQSFGSSPIADADTSTLKNFKGIYCAKPVFLDKYPVILSHKADILYATAQVELAAVVAVMATPSLCLPERSYYTTIRLIDQFSPLAGYAGTRRRGSELCFSSDTCE